MPPIHIIGEAQLTASRSPKSLGLMLFKLACHLSDHFHFHDLPNPPSNMNHSA